MLFHTNMMPKDVAGFWCLNSVKSVLSGCLAAKKSNKLMLCLFICHFIASFSNEEVSGFWFFFWLGVAMHAN